MRRILLILFIVIFSFGLPGCGGRTQEASDSAASEEGISSDNSKEDDDRDVSELMGMEHQVFKERYDAGMVEEMFDGEDAGQYEAEYYYVLKNGTEVAILEEKVVSVRVDYSVETEYPAPEIKTIDGGDDYDSVVEKLGGPYHQGPEQYGEKQEEIFAAVFYLGNTQYLKIYFDPETERVCRASCFYAEEPDVSEAGSIKIGDSLDALKGAYQELYYTTAYYSADQGEPKYNRIYYTPMEERDGEGIKCLDFYVCNGKIVKIESNYRDYLGWSSYEDIFGMENVYKEINMDGHIGNIIYFYEDADGGERILLKVENSAAEERDIDEDGITEILAYKTEKAKAVVIYDYDTAAEAVMILDVCAALGADWSEYLANAANVKNEYRNCIEAGFREADGIERAEVYSVKDNSLTYIGPHSPEFFQ